MGQVVLRVCNLHSVRHQRQLEEVHRRGRVVLAQDGHRAGHMRRCHRGAELLTITDRAEVRRDHTAAWRQQVQEWS